MSSLSERLATLRRQAGQVPDLGVAGRGVRPMLAEDVALRSADAIGQLARPRATIEIDALRRMLGLRARIAMAVAVEDGVLPGIEIAPGLRYVERFIDHSPAADAMSTAIPGFETIARRDLLHFDTETTGLSGGTGTRAFMVGVADWPDQRLRVRQLYIATMAAETAMLQTFARWLQPHQVLVSYNGRCYDAPLLATRYRLARLPNPLQGLRHLDLLFPVRRRYRGVWENCRLATIERNLLGVLREDDLPGSEAPRAWLDYLRRGDAKNLRRVLVHNDQDLVTLAQLLQRLSL